MSDRLGREIKRAMTKARLSSPELGRRAEVGESWIRQLVSGRIQRPAPDKLRRIARELGLDEVVLLGMTDQLGATMAGAGSDTTQPVPANLQPLLDRLKDQAEAITALVEELRAARQGRDETEERLRALEAAARLRVQSAGATPPERDVRHATAE